MNTHGLGPNGGMLYCMEYLEANFDWLEEELGKLPKDVYIMFDLPGQVEFWTNHESLKRIVDRLSKAGFRVRALKSEDHHSGLYCIWISWQQYIYVTHIT